MPFSKTALLRKRLFGKKTLLLLLSLLLVISLFEFVLSNHRRLFIYDTEKYPHISLTEYAIVPPEEDGSFLCLVTAAEQAHLDFSGVPGGLYSLSFDVMYVDPAIKDTLPAVTATVKCTDPRTTWTGGGFITVITETIPIGEDGESTRVTLYGSVEKEGDGRIRLALSGVKDDVRISNVTLNAPESYRFSLIRVLSLFLCFAALTLLSQSTFAHQKYDPASVDHRMIVRTVVPFTFLLALLFASVMIGTGDRIPYPLTGEVRYYQPYIQQFDALMKGQLALDVPVPDGILTLENPYDYASRLPFQPLWDRAYYDGSYYSYFGMTPIFIVYFPFYFFTKALPSDGFVMSFFFLLSAIFIPFVVIKWADRHEKRTLPIPLVWLGAFAAFCGSLMPLLARGVTPFYYIASMAGNAFLALFLVLLLCASDAAREGTRRLCLLAAGISYALLFHARMNLALVAAFLVVPYLFFSVLRIPKKDEENGSLPRRFAVAFLRQIPALCALGIPVMLGIAAALALNVARFDSLLEFGTSYQFTVSDIRKNHLALSDLGPAIYHYFFHPITLTSDFPYLSLRYVSSANYGHYVYVDTGLGLFALPLMKLLYLSPAAFFLRSRTREEKSYLIALLLALPTVALLDFSLGGVIFRYTMDLTLVAAVASVCLLFALYRAFTGDHTSESTTGGEAKICARDRAAYAVCMIFLLVSILAALLLSLSTNANLSHVNTDTIFAIRNFVTFR